MARVFIGVDPHKLSATPEVVDETEKVLATGRFATDKAGYAAMRKHVASYPERIWAVEGSNGAGRPLAQRLRADAEHPVDVPAKLSARARALDTGHNRKTDPLAMAIYASLVYPEPSQVLDALALSATHSGDSDSTGAICGNILGALHGETALPPELAFEVEGRGTILTFADDFVYELSSGDRLHGDYGPFTRWTDRYPRVVTGGQRSDSSPPTARPGIQEPRIIRRSRR